MAGPIGISFLPSDENQQQGLKRAGTEGDLAQAMKILSLNLRQPSVWGAKSITPGANLPGGTGGSAALSNIAGSSSDAGGGFNPNSALFEAVIKALMNNGANPGAVASDPAGGSAMGSSGLGASVPAPRITPIDDTGTGRGVIQEDPAPSDGQVVTDPHGPQVVDTPAIDLQKPPSFNPGYNPNSPLYGNAGDVETGGASRVIPYWMKRKAY